MWELAFQSILKGTEYHNGALSGFLTILFHTGIRTWNGTKRQTVDCEPPFVGGFVVVVVVVLLLLLLLLSLMLLLLLLFFFFFFCRLFLLLA